MNDTLLRVTERIIERSRPSRQKYLDRMRDAGEHIPDRKQLSCGNLAHGFAACSESEKNTIKLMNAANLGIVTAYNDMLSAHHPYERFPNIIKSAAREMGCTAQVAGGTPAMCDGVTQGQPGMELSLFSRDTIAMATGVALSHNMFDAAMYLGVCDKIVPGLVIGALRFGYLPTVFVPAGPMPSGLPNSEKARIRQEFAQGKVGRDELLQAESDSYHSAGTCTFYGTANTNQMLMEFMGLHLPGSSFVNPDNVMRDALTREATHQAVRITKQNGRYTPLFDVLDERAFVNGIVGLLSTGGSTNLTIHLIAMARAAGIVLTWDDFSDLSKIVPSLAKVYPNGMADVNHFHAAGGLGYVMGELLDAGLLHNDVKTIMGEGLNQYTHEPFLDDDDIVYRDGTRESLNEDIVRPASNPFNPQGGLQVLKGNLGTGVIKVSAVKPEQRIIEAPAVIFESQHDLQASFKAGDLDKDCIVVVRFQGPKANGMPELHKLTPPLGVLQDKGYKVALVTDGRMSGASGKVPAAIHMSPEASEGGPLAKVQPGDVIRLDAEAGTLEIKVSPEEWERRELVRGDLSGNQFGVGRELFAHMRDAVSAAEQGATVFRFEDFED
ncbi:phosphogluconate dehydratase [Saccharospirillum salsuginis]|uniref:Phosphogluconate dehydratase n=1 Tax=Saccharospirillum salsuginis TaxID=418750 RepID=A0A918K187_9GAMM|nr:phosphogluconate dehydratase [Saccharospirillum salsuginis]GGX39535.1 phosphogluconate dehydratase [Saccharospirillum salsuginis]